MFVHIVVSENVSCKIRKQVSCISSLSYAVLPWFGGLFSSCWCCDPRCLAGVEVCRGENARQSTTSCIKSTLAKSLTADITNWLSIGCQKIGTPIACQWKLKIPPLWQHLEKYVSLSFWASGFLYINSETSVKFFQFGCNGRKRDWIPTGSPCGGQKFSQKNNRNAP